MVAALPPPGTPADPTLTILEKFKDPSQWVIVRNVPVFDSHDEVDERPTSPTYGQVVRHFGQEELQRIAYNCNVRDRQGNPCRLTEGHTVPNLPEREQPGQLGYARNFHLGRFGPEQKDAILVDYWVHKDKYELARTYPYRSVELYVRDMIFNPIAMLRRTPQRDLGEVHFSRHDEPVRYEKGADVVRYSIEDFTMPETFPPAAGAATPPPAAPVQDPDALSPDDVAVADKYMKHYVKNHPVMRYASDMFEGCPPDVKQKYAASAPSGTNTAVPVAAPALPAEGAGTSVPPDVQRMQRDQLAIHYAKLDHALKAIQERNAALESALRAEQLKTQRAARERDLVQLEAEGYQFDRAGMLADVADLEPAQYAKSLEYVRKYGRQERAPVGAVLPIATHSDPSAAAKRYSREEVDRAVKMAESGMDYAEALRKVRAG